MQGTAPHTEPVVSSEADAYERLLREADTLVKDGKPAEAYTLLEPLEFEHAGEVRFDYLIGIAALDSGKPDKATFAFERVLAVDPDNAAARLDMARAYYQLGDFQRAGTEFTAALRQNPPAAARANIEKYLEKIDAQKEGRKAHFSAYIEGGYGRDSNVNSSTSQQRVFVDLFVTTATLDAASVKVPDNYYTAAAGGEIDYRLTENWGLYAGADLRKRGNSNQKQFDSVSLDARAGVMYEARENSLRAGVLSGRYDLGGVHNSDISGFKGEWRHVFSPKNQLNVFAQSVQYRYVDVIMKPNDFDQQAFGIGWQHVMADGRSSLSGSVHSGSEKDVSPIVTLASPQGGRNDGASRFSGFRLGGQTDAGERATLFATAGMQTGDYDKTNYYFLRRRHDRLVDLTVGANWQWNKVWTLRPQFVYIRNESNIAIYSYDRKDFSLTIRRDFR